MKATIIFICFIASTGCVQTKHGVMNDKTTIALINDRAAFSTVEITLNSGESLVVHDLKIARDTLSWLEINGVGMQRMPISKIASVAFVKKRSAFQRGMTGAVLGMLSGGIMAYGVGAIEFSSEFSKEYFAPAGAIFGIGIGGFVGALTTFSTDVIYEFEQFREVE